jgi:uncharacterized lipoprotein YddW (UPF0748 family)
MINKTRIAQVMDSLANNNFNVVFFNGWKRGYPLWRSKVYYRETGIYTNPIYGDRDPLAEAIAEAHRRGLEVEVWMEYGFVAWWSGNGIGSYPKGYIFAKHPDWLAKDKAGNDAFPSGSSGNFYWMSHTNPGPQKFLIDLCIELVEEYDIDGIELDRLRYPSTDCGYDDYTTNLYKTEKGVAPPTNNSDPVWKRWRADKLNDFSKAAYDSVKKHNPFTKFTNAPSHYASGNIYPAYDSYLQDWAAWINGGYLDAAQVQMYVDLATLNVYIESILQYRVTNPTLRNSLSAGIAVNPNGTPFTAATVVSMIQLTRSKGLGGNSIWYYSDLHPYFTKLKQDVYQSPSIPPYRSAGWRTGAVIEDEKTQTRTSGWKTLAFGWENSSIYVGPEENQSIDYVITVPYDAWYEVYAYQLVSWDRTSRAPYDLYDSSGNAQRVLVNQSIVSNGGWYKLGDIYLHSGRRRVAQLTNQGIESDRVVGADAIMLILNRRLSPSVITEVEKQGSAQPTQIRLHQNYPNPFNPNTAIRYQLPSNAFVRLDIYDLLGRHVTSLVDEWQKAGDHEVILDSSFYASGVYFCELVAGGTTRTTKMMLLR